MTSEAPDYYALLGVPRDASLETIKHVYRQLAKAYHPDASQGNSVGEERLKQITEAWETLSDPERRAIYDLSLGVPGGHATGGRAEGAASGGGSTRSTLSPEASRLVVEQPPGWEYMLFPQVLQDEIDKSAGLKAAYLRGDAVGSREQVSIATIKAWSDPLMQQLDRLVADIESAINVRVPPAFGAPGESGDAREIESVARFIAARYREIIEWSLRVRCASGPPGFPAVVDAFARFPDDVLAKVESAGRPLLQRVVASIDRALAGYPVDLEIRLDFELSHREEFSAALKRLR